MSEEQIKELISNEVNARINAEKKMFAKMVEGKFLYMGQWVGARDLIDVVEEWAEQSSSKGN